MGDKLKKEIENLDKMKKMNAELNVSKAAATSVVSDLNDKISALTEDRNLLERETAKLQSQIQLEKNQRNEHSRNLQESNLKVQTLQKEFNALKDREQMKISRNIQC